MIAIRPPSFVESSALAINAHERRYRLRARVQQRHRPLAQVAPA